MLGFWLIAAILVVAACAIIVLPLWYSRPESTVSRDAINTDIFRERLVDLDTEHQEGRITDLQYRQLRAELERTLLVDVPQELTHRSPLSRMASTLAVVAGLTIPLLALSYYYAFSLRGDTQDWIDLQARLEDAVEHALLRSATLPPQAEMDPIGFTRVLQARLSADGLQDADGLLLLGTNYLRLQAPQAALAALQRAYELEPKRPEISVAYAQAMMFADEGRLNEGGARLLSQVLQTHPNHRRALMLIAFGAFNSGRYDDAIEAWQQLRVMGNPTGEAARLLERSIARAKELRDESRQAADTTTTPAPNTSPPQVTVTVGLSRDLQQRLAPQDTLYIFARAASGPPMPLAAVRQPARGFPVQVVLDDSQAMTSSMKLSNFQQVVVGARISKSGEAIANPGDLEGVSEPLDLAEGPQSVSLMIDEVVQ